MSSVFYTTELDLIFPALGLIVEPYTSYVVEVAAETIRGRGPYSEGIMIYTPEDGKILYYIFMAIEWRKISNLTPERKLNLW